MWGHNSSSLSALYQYMQLQVAAAKEVCKSSAPVACNGFWSGLFLTLPKTSQVSFVGLSNSCGDTKWRDLELTIFLTVIIDSLRLSEVTWALFCVQSVFVRLPLDKWDQEKEFPELAALVDETEKYVSLGTRRPLQLKIYYAMQYIIPYILLCYYKKNSEKLIFISKGLIYGFTVVPTCFLVYLCCFENAG